VAIYLQGVGASSFLFSYNAVDLTDHVRSITVNMDYEDVDVTAMGAVSRAHSPGLRDDYIEVEFYQDFASSKVDATLNGYLGSASGATVLVQTSGSTVSATQPKYTMVGSPFTYQPINATVGDASMTSVQFRPVASSSITRGTS
jgi:hypothetical protein